MDIDKLPGHDFEDLVEKLIKHLGFITEERNRSADGGIDIRAISEKPILKGLYIIQCKRYKKPISESIIRDLYGVVSSERANKGILITNSNFTKAAEKFAKNKPLELINGNKLVQLLEEYLKEKVEKINEHLIIPEEYIFTLEYFKKHQKRISDRRKDINDKRIFLDPKYYKSERAYISFVLKKFKKLIKILEVFSNQFNNISNIWSCFSKNKNNYTNLQELKNQCRELISTIDFIGKEQEEAVATIPPDNYYLMNINNALKNAYNPFFNVFFETIDQLSLMINNPEDSRLIKEVENGKEIVKLNVVLSEAEIEILERELEKYNSELEKYNNSEHSQSKKHCFVATAVYEDINAKEVKKLRKWRDEVLCNYKWGNLIIKIYYLFGPSLAIWIKKFPKIKKIIKLLLEVFINKISI